MQNIGLAWVFSPEYRNLAYDSHTSLVSQSSGPEYWVLSSSFSNFLPQGDRGPPGLDGRNGIDGKPGQTGPAGQRVSMKNTTDR